MAFVILRQGLRDDCPDCGEDPPLTDCTLWLGRVWHQPCAKKYQEGDGWRDAKKLADATKWLPKARA